MSKAAATLRPIDKGAVPAEGGRIRVFIADDHPLVHDGLRVLLDAGGMTVVGDAYTGVEAVERVRSLNPDVILMDIRMPDMDGLAATQAIKQELPEASVVIITSYESKDYLRRAIEAGASGYLLKGMPPAAIVNAIKAVCFGGSFIDGRLLADLMLDIRSPGNRCRAEDELEALTPREQQVLGLLVQGLTNKEIARELNYSPGTVKNTVHQIISKLHVSDRTQAAIRAVKEGQGHSLTV